MQCRKGGGSPPLMTTSAVSALQEGQAFLGLAASPRARLLLTCRITLQKPVVQGSISLKLVLSFSPRLEFHRLLIFKLFLEEVGGGGVPKGVFHSSHFVGAVAKGQFIQGSIVGRRM